MKAASFLFFATSLFIFFSACSKSEEAGRPILQKGLRGKILYSSCATTAVQVLNKNVGSEWSNCVDRRVYEHVINANIINRNGIAVGEEFDFNIVEGEPSIVCDMLDCNPEVAATIVITGD